MSTSLTSMTRQLMLEWSGTSKSATKTAGPGGAVSQWEIGAAAADANQYLGEGRQPSSRKAKRGPAMKEVSNRFRPVDAMLLAPKVRTSTAAAKLWHVGEGPIEAHHPKTTAAYKEGMGMINSLDRFVFEEALYRGSLP
jgi:hypothetical protein